MNVLISSASRKVSLIKAFKMALSKEGGGKVIAVDINSKSPALFFSNVAYLVSESINPSFIVEILNICKKEEVELIIPTRDEELKIFAINKDRFNEIGTKIILPDLKILEICLDKLLFIEFCKTNNFPIPKTYRLEEIKEIRFPLFINHRFGKSSKKAYKVNSKKELDLFLQQIDEPIIQDYIEDKEYTIDLFADLEGRVISVVPRERIYTFGGESFIGKTCKNWSLIESAISLAEKLKLIGHNTIQCFLSEEGEVKFIEVNPRYGGGVNLSIAAGANTPLYLIQLLKGKRLESEIGNFQDNLVMLRYTEDIFLKEERLENIKRIYE